MRNLQPLSNRMAPAPGSSLAEMKSRQLARDDEERVRAKRIKGVVVLMEQFLLEQGYTQSLQALQQESHVSLQEYSAADNVDLLSVVQEFEEYYTFKCQRKPKLYRLRAAGDDDEGRLTVREGGEKLLMRKRKSMSSTGLGSSSSLPPPLPPTGYGNVDNFSDAASNPSNSGPASAPPTIKPPAHLRTNRLGHAQSHHATAPTGTIDLSLKGEPAKMLTVSSQQNTADGATGGGDDNLPYNRALRPLPQFPTSELSDLAATIMREILDVNPSVGWDDIVDLDDAKHLLKEAVVMPVKYPDLFRGIMRPWKGILLFGPPGTGKTLLAKAVATECRTTFFSISASSVVSKWRGDSEKLIRMLFDLAVHYAPSTIFIDEVDSLITSRSMEGEHEGSRRLKTELLTQMDGLSKRRGGEIVFVLAASNVPWDLDAAMLRRLEKRVLVGLPTHEARRELFQKLLSQPRRPGDTAPPLMDWDVCANLTDGMSGADIDIICREASMRPIRLLISQLEAVGNKKGAAEKLSPVPLQTPQATLEDVEASVACTRSSVRLADLARYAQWAADYGSGLST